MSPSSREIIGNNIRVSVDAGRKSPTKVAFAVQESRFHGDKALHPKATYTPAPGNYNPPIEHTTKPLGRSAMVESLASNIYRAAGKFLDHNKERFAPIRSDAPPPNTYLLAPTVADSLYKVRASSIHVGFSAHLRLFSPHSM